MRIGIFGPGKLGSAIAELGGEQVVWCLGPDEVPSTEVDVAIDASMAQAVPGHLQWAIENKTDLVIGTTGWEMQGIGQKVNMEIGVLVSTNFSVTVALMARFAEVIGAYADLEPTRDLFVFEHHHNKKLDAPSGTAKTLAQALLFGSATKTTWTGGTPAPDEIHVASLRSGSEVGRHEVGFDSPSEQFVISHRARSRNVFAEGALATAKWLHGKKGVYSMQDFAQDLLDPLFAKRG